MIRQEQPIKIMIADDHPLIRQGLRALFASEADLEVVSEATDGQDVLDKVRHVTPDVIVLDITMPILSGIQITERIVAECPGVKVLVLSYHIDNVYVEQLLGLGASGYIAKSSPSEEVLAGIRAVARGEVFIDRILATTFAQRLSMTRSSRRSSTLLSPREEQVVRLIALGHSNKEIADLMDLSVKTIENYKARAVEKVGLKSRADIVKFASDCGWLKS